MRSGIVTRKALFLMVVIVAALVAADHDQVSGGIGTWTAKLPIPTARAGLAVGVVDGILYAVGGDTGADPYLSLVEAYNPTTNTWKSKAPMPTARSVLAVGVVNGILYAVGGISKHVAGRILDTVEAYNPATDTWTTKAPMPTPRFGLAVGVVDGILYAVGGETDDGLVGIVEAYDPIANRWTSKAALPSGRFLHAAGAANGILYVTGGVSARKGGAPPNDLIAYFPRDLLAFKP